MYHFIQSYTGQEREPIFQRYIYIMATRPVLAVFIYIYIYIYIYVCMYVCMYVYLESILASI
jgi:hypothetical protein